MVYSSKNSESGVILKQIALECLFYLFFNEISACKNFILIIF